MRLIDCEILPARHVAAWTRASESPMAEISRGTRFFHSDGIGFLSVGPRAPTNSVIKSVGMGAAARHEC